MQKQRLESYTLWLLKEGYQQSTVSLTLRHLRRICVNLEHCELSHNAPHVRRYMRFVADTRRNPLGEATLGVFKKAGFSASAITRKTGQRTKMSLNPEQSAQLKARLRRGREPIDKLLVAYMQSRLRIGEFLSLCSEDINERTLPDKISRDWIQAAFTPDLAFLYETLCKTKRCAYYRMRMCLIAEGRRLGLDVDFDTIYKTRNELQPKQPAP